MVYLATTLPTPDWWDQFLAYLHINNAWKSLVNIVAIIIIALIARIILRFVINRSVDRIVNGVKKKQNVADTHALLSSPLAAARTVQRTRTLGNVLNNIVSVVIVIVAVLLIVTSINPTITASFALLTGALGAGLGFGAQNVVKDVLNGLFMVAEDQYGVGDVVDVGAATGVVEAVAIRITTIRDVNGTVWFCRNGEILRVGNMSQGWSRVILDLAVPYDADVEEVQRRILAAATELATNTKWRARIIEKPELWGIESISAEAIVIRLVLKTVPGSKDDVARELRATVKSTLDDMGVQLPSLNAVVLSGFDGAESVGGARPPRTTPSPVVTTEDPKPPRGTRKSTVKDPRATTLPLPQRDPTTAPPEPKEAKPKDE
jgi:moderate conductance mechanosensitive channel